MIWRKEVRNVKCHGKVLIDKLKFNIFRVLHTFAVVFHFYVEYFSTSMILPTHVHHFAPSCDKQHVVKLYIFDLHRAYAMCSYI